MKKNELTFADIKGSQLASFYEYVFSEDQPLEPELNICDFFEGLTELPNLNDNSIYILCDAQQWDPEASFFDNYLDLVEAFSDSYLDDIDEWENLSDQELSSWLDRIKDEFTGITMYTYDVVN